MKSFVLTLGKISLRRLCLRMWHIARFISIRSRERYAWYFVFRGRKRERKRESRSCGALRFFQDKPRLMVILLGYSPGQFSSFHLPAPVYLLPGRPSRILINRSTARSRFFVTVVRKNGVPSYILERSLRNWCSFFRADDALNPRIIYSYHVVGVTIFFYGNRFVSTLFDLIFIDITMTFTKYMLLNTYTYQCTREN